MSRKKDCFTVFKVKVTMRAHIIKMPLSAISSEPLILFAATRNLMVLFLISRSWQSFKISVNVCQSYTFCATDLYQPDWVCRCTTTNIARPSENKVGIFLCSISLSLVGNLGRLTRVRHSSCKSSATHSYQWVVPITIFVCPDNSLAASTWDF